MRYTLNSRDRERETPKEQSGHHASTGDAQSTRDSENDHCTNGTRHTAACSDLKYLHPDEREEIDFRGDFKSL